MLHVITMLRVKNTIWSNLVDLHQANPKQDGGIKGVSNTMVLEENTDWARQKPLQMNLFTFGFGGEVMLEQQLWIGTKF